MTQKNYPVALAVLLALVLGTMTKLNAQNVFWNEDFSDSLQYNVTLGAVGNNGTSNYFHRTDGSNINKTYNGVTGYFFAGQDIDDSGWNGSASPSQLTWNGIDINGKTNLEFTGMFGEVFDSPGDIDDSDYLYLEYRIDNGSWDTLIAFRNDGSTFNTKFYEDTNLDGIGDGDSISDGSMHSFTKQITQTGDSIALRFTAALNSGDEDFAIDEFELAESGATPTPVTFLWEESFDNDLSGIDTVSVTGQETWVHDSYGGATYAKISGYSGSAMPNEDWLISPAMDLSNFTSANMVFKEAINYESATINDREEVYVSTNYNGDPSAATWTELTVTSRAGGSSWTFVEVDTIDLSSYLGNSNVHVAFKYTSDASSAGTWEIDYAQVFGETAASVPSVSLSTQSISGLEYTEGNGPSTADTFMISATDIQDSVVLASSGNFELSLNSMLTFSDTLILDDTAGVFSNIEVNVRLKSGLAADVYSGNIKISTSGMSDKNISLSGEVKTPPNPNELWFEDFKPDLAGIDTVSVVGPQVWEHGSYGSDNNCAVMNGYDGSANANEDWLISPVMDFSSQNNIKMAFSEAINYESGNVNDREEIYVSLDYAGDPTAATWTELSVTGRAAGDSWSFVDVDTADLSAYAGEPSVTIGFKYTSDTTSAATWEIDHVNVFIEPLANEPSSHVSLFEAAATDSTIVDVTWSDVSDADGYLIKMSENGYSSISAPVDGTPEQDDTDYSDGNGVINVAQGTEFYAFDSLKSNTEYAFMIWPYANSGVNIDYKTDGTVPQDTAMTPQSTTGINENSDLQLISRPYVDNQMLTFEMNIKGKAKINLYNLNGQIVRSKLVANGLDEQVEIPVGDIKTRMFILSIEAENNRSVYKIIH